MKRSIEGALSNAAVCAIAVLLSCTLPSGWCNEGTYVRGLRYYRKAESGKPKPIDCDVAVYGGTPAGVTAAIQAARAGRKAVLLSFNRHVGGMTSGGLTATDVGRKESIGGLAREFYTRIGDSNNAGSFSSDYVGGNYRWPDGTYEPGSYAKLPQPRRGVPIPFRELYELRERIFQDHVNYQQGLMYFLANDPRVPKRCETGLTVSGSTRASFRIRDSGRISFMCVKAVAWFPNT